MNEHLSSTTFLPKKSNGGIWSIGFLVGLLLIFCIPLVIMGFIGDPWFIVFMGSLIGLLSIVFGVTVHGYYTMKYVINSDSLVLKWSFFKKTIPIQEISTVSSVMKSNLQGIRSFGVGIPGHFVGKFHLKFEGEFLSTTLFATKLDPLVVLRTKDNKIYGITPDQPEEFIISLQTASSSIQKIDLDTLQPIRKTEEQIKKSNRWITSFFITCLVILIGTFIYFIIAYQGLPETGVPMHWGVNGEVDRFGNRTELLTMVSIFTGAELLISILVYIWMRKSDLGKSKLGKFIMLFPLILVLVFSTLVIVITQATLNYF